MNFNEINKAYAIKFDNEIATYVDHHNVEMFDRAAYLRRYGYFITFIFKRDMKLAFSHDEDRDNPQFKNFDLIYNLACRKLLGRRYSKHLDQQPLVIAALDVNGTKVSRHVQSVENIHLHTIWVLRPDLDDKFASFIENARTLKQFEKTDILRVDVRRIDGFETNDHGTSRLSSYVSKFLGQNTERMLITSDDWRIYPLELGDVKKVAAKARKRKMRETAQTESARALINHQAKMLGTSNVVSIEQFFETEEDCLDRPAYPEEFSQQGYWDSVFSDYEEWRNRVPISAMEVADLEFQWASRSFQPDRLLKAA